MNFEYWGIPSKGNRKDVPDSAEGTGERVKMGFTDFGDLQLILGVPRGRAPRRDAPTPQGGEG